MPTYPKIGRFNAPQSMLQLSKFSDGWNSQMAGFLLPLARRNFRYHDYQFGTTQTMTTELTAAGGGGASNSAYAILGTVENGLIRGTTGTGTRTTSIVQIKQNSLNFDAARNPGFEVRWKFGSVTDLAYEAEFLGVEPGTQALHNQSALSAAGVPTIVSNTSSDQFGVAFNAGAGTLHTAALISKGSTDAAAGALIGTHAPTAATYFVVRIQGRANGAYAAIDDTLDASISLGPDTAVLMRPSLLASNDGSATSILSDINYWRIWAEWV